MNCTHCRRKLRWQSVRMGLDKCRQCRQREKYHVQREFGRIVGEAMARLIGRQV